MKNNLNKALATIASSPKEHEEAIQNAMDIITDTLSESLDTSYVDVLVFLKDMRILCTALAESDETLIDNLLSHGTSRSDHTDE